MEKIGMSNSYLKNRLLNLIRSKFQEHGDLQKDTLFLEGRIIDLKPLTNLFDYIPASDEFIRLPPLFDASENFPISDMYVELTVAQTQGTAQPLLLQRGSTIASEQEERYRQHTSARLDIHQCINSPQNKKIVVLGDPGCGKTSLLKYLCLEIAQGNNQQWLIPLFISLKRYWVEKQADPNLTLLRYATIILISHRNSSGVSSQYSIFRGATYHSEQQAISDLEHLLIHLSSNNRKDVYFLLDGLDEIATHSEAVAEITKDIKHLGNHFAWILTSRHTGFYGGLNQDVCYEVLKLNNSGIDELVRNWFNNNGLGNQQYEQEAILKQIGSNNRLKDMAANPFLLTLLCHLHHRSPNQELPINRSDVYSGIIKLMQIQLRYRNNNNLLLRGSELNYLSKFCHHLYTEANNAPLQIFEYEHWDLFAHPSTPPDFDVHILPSRLVHSWRQGGDFHFVHLTFQEYLIALHLSQYPFDEVDKNLFSPHWKIVYRFLAGIYSQQINSRNLELLITALLSPVDNMGLLYVEAAHCLIEAGIEDSTDILSYDLRDNLWELWNHKDAEYVKDAAGEVLAVLSPNYIVQKIFVLKLEDQKNDYELLRAIRLLGYMHSEKFDEYILGFLHDDKPSIRAMAIGAIAVKNTKTLRQAIIDLYLESPSVWFNVLCTLALETKHKVFIKHLKPYLSRRPADIEEYDLLFRAIAAIGAIELEPDFLSLVRSYPTNELTDDTIESLVSLKTEGVQNWVKESALNDNEDFREDVVYYALECELLSPEQQSLHLLSDNLDHQCRLLTAVLHQVQKGVYPDRVVLQTIMDIAFSDSSINSRAITVLEQLKFGSLLDNEIKTLKRQCHQYLDESHDDEMLIGVISILGELVDVLAYPKIKKFAVSGKFNGVQSMAINAVGNFNKVYSKDVKTTLHELYKTIRHENGDIANDTLTALANIDIKEIIPYIEDTNTYEVMTVLCARQSVLLFSDSYIDSLGNRHVFETVNDQKLLDPNSSPLQQVELLRQHCLDALEQGEISKSSNNSDALPLFTKNEAGINHNNFESVSFNTGKKFLNSETVGRASIRLIFNRFKKICWHRFIN